MPVQTRAMKARAAAIKRASRKAARAANKTEVIVRYTCDGIALTAAQTKEFIKKLKKEDYYHDYLSGKFKAAFSNEGGYTTGVFTIKDAPGNEATSRVLGMLTGIYYNTLPAGVSAVLIQGYE
jgi:hypothetical protein